MTQRTLTLIAVRHGETEWNQIGKSQHLLDSALTARGKRQMHQVGQTLLSQYGETISTIHTSQLGRAMSSARIIAGYLKAPIVSQGELNEFERALQRDSNAEKWLNQIIRQHTRQNPCLIVGHGDWIASLASLVNPSKPLKTLDNGQIIEIQIEI